MQRPLVFLAYLSFSLTHKLTDWFAITFKMSKPAKVLQIPKQFSSNESLAEIVARYRALRLTALQRSPEAFTSTYAREAQFDDKTWTIRVLNPLATVFIVPFPDAASEDIGTRPDLDEDMLMKRPWLGQLTLTGPLFFPINDEKAARAPWELFKNIDFEQAARDAASIPAGSNVIYVLVGMYVLPEGRGAGNGQRLLEAAIRAVDEESKANKVNAKVIVLVARENKTAKRLYERVGFVSWEEGVDIEGEAHWALSLTLAE